MPPTVAYAQELIDTFGLPVELRRSRRTSGATLARPRPWYKHLAGAYAETMFDLGVGSGMQVTAFLDATECHKAAHPGMAMVLSAIKSTVKGGIGKFRERPQGTSTRPVSAGQPWSTLPGAPTSEPR